MICFADIIETVVNDRCDFFAVRTVRFLLDQRSDGEDLIHGVRRIADLIHQLVGHLGVKISQQAIERMRRILADKEFIGVREKIALKTNDVALVVIVDKRIVKCRVPGSFQKVFFRIDAVLCKQRDRLADAVALGNRDLDRVGVERCVFVAHPVDERIVVHFAVELVLADADLVLRMTDPGKELEEPPILDQPLLLQLF